MAQIHINRSPVPPPTKNIGMLDALAQVLDLPKNWAIKEAVPKLGETFVRLNGKICFLVNIDKYGAHHIKWSDGNHVYEEMRSNDQVKSLEVFLPESGVYRTTDGSVVVLTKNPLRQWKRSFNNNIYNIYNMVDSGRYAIENIIEDSRVDLWFKSNGTIFYFDIAIGYITKDNRVMCTNPLYEQELIDWINNGQAAKAFRDFKVQAIKQV